MPASPPSSQPRRILVRGVNWLGDAVMSTPALMRLRAAHPQAHISLLTHEKLAELWDGHPAIDEVIPFRSGEGALQVGRRLRAERFDLGLALPNSVRSALELWLARIPRRVGYASQWRRLLLTNPVSQRPGAVTMHKRSAPEIRALIAGERGEERPIAAGDQAHHIHQYLHLVASVGASPAPLAPQLVVSNESVERLRKRFGFESEAAPLFGLNPGAEYGPAKRWPVDRFVAAAREIQMRIGCRWLIFGGKGDAELANRIQAELSTPDRLTAPVNLAGQTSLGELSAGLKVCRVLLTNDTGPMHVAAALGTPVVALFGSTSPELTAPGLPGDLRQRILRLNVPCSPCFLRECPIDFRCMNGISVQMAVAAVLETARRAGLPMNIES